MAIALGGDDLGHLYDPHGGRRDLDARPRARAALGLVPRRPDAAAAGRPLRDPPGLRDGRGHRAHGARGGRRGRALDGLGRARAGRADGPAAPSTRRPPRSSGCTTSGWTARWTRRSTPIPELVASASLGAAAIGADRALASLAALVAEAPDALDDWLDSLQLEARDRDRRRARGARCAGDRGAAARARAHALGAARPARRRAARGARAGARAGRARRSRSCAG